MHRTSAGRVTAAEKRETRRSAWHDVCAGGSAVKNWARQCEVDFFIKGERMEATVAYSTTAQLEDATSASFMATVIYYSAPSKTMGSGITRARASEEKREGRARRVKWSERKERVTMKQTGPMLLRCCPQPCSLRCARDTRCPRLTRLFQLLGRNRLGPQAQGRGRCGHRGGDGADLPPHRGAASRHLWCRRHYPLHSHEGTSSSPPPSFLPSNPS